MEWEDEVGAVTQSLACVMYHETRMRGLELIGAVLHFCAPAPVIVPSSDYIFPLTSSMALHLVSLYLRIIYTRPGCTTKHSTPIEGYDANRAA